MPSSSHASGRSSRKWKVEYLPTSMEFLEDLLLRDTHQHIANIALQGKKLVTTFKGHGTVSKGHKWYGELPNMVKARIDHAGFLLFVTLLVDSQNDRMVIHALAERWWDSTNTFHLPFGEMTMTPLNFHVITDLCFGVRELSMKNDLCSNLDRVEALVGYAQPKYLAGT